MVIDPICCLTVDESTERRAHFNGATMFFCSERCREKFLSAPDAEKLRISKHDSRAHTCEKHPELWQEDPCDCPKCRMALDPATQSLETVERETSNSPETSVPFQITAAVVSTITRGWRAITTMPLNGFINPPGQSLPKFRKRLGTTNTSS